MGRDVPVFQSFMVSFVEKRTVLASGFAIADSDIVVISIKSNSHLVVTRDKRRFVINSMIVNVITGVIIVVQVDVAAVIIALRAIVRRIVTNHSNVAVGVLNIVGTIFVDIVVEPRTGDINMI